MIAFWDFLPTACELAGVKTPGGLDGVSVRRALSGQRMTERPPLYWEFHENRFSQAVRVGDWKAVRTDREKPVELYRLSQDVGETRDVSADNKDRVREMERLMNTLRVESAAFLVK